MDSEEQTCYICYEPANANNQFCKSSPCLCRGSISIHTACLIEARKRSPTCSICKSFYADKTPGEYIELGRVGQLLRVSYINKDYYQYIYTVNNDGLKHGEFIMYYPSERVRAIQNYIYGELYGESKTFYDNEQNSLLATANYVNNQKHGILKSYTQSGQLQKEFNYNNGVQHGQCIEYNESGELYKVFNYANGVLDGECTIYFPRNLIKKMVYKNGQLESEKTIHNGIIRKIFCFIK